ncbi:MAG: VCBS repeat-containing protein, partial [Candidatus Marinimicrobia bacterium]|nr:VCBS repeat-containing protein [Candidatus Neomarinimicrobiota bacterium]
MDNDGDLDIVSASVIDDAIAWYENDGAADPSFTAADIATSADAAHSVFAADMDNDGDLDIVSASADDNTIAWYENNGAADPSFTAADIATSAEGAASVFVADMDNDGDLDIVSASYTDDAIAWYENASITPSLPSFTERTIEGNFDGAQEVYAVDMDGDGDMDVVGAAFTEHDIAWFENNGSQSFTERTIEDSFLGARSVYAVDMDGDGDMDVVGAAYSDDDIAWFENNGSQSFTERTIE